MFGIIGSGFGLYGHLPAIAKSSPEPILVPKRYLPVFEKRTELKQFEPVIQWVEDEDAILNKATAMVISVWPPGQEVWINKCLEQANIKTLILEKPLAATPGNSKTLLTALIASGKIFRVNYSFIYTAWYAKIMEALKEAELISLNIHWCFLAHHYKHALGNWKRSRSSGGGAIRFYGIHVLAIFAALGVSNVITSETRGESEEDVASWEAGFTDGKKGLCKISINSASALHEFTISLVCKKKSGKEEQLNILMQDPFSDIVAAGDDIDPRTEISKKIHHSLNERRTDLECYSLYKGVNDLWLLAEQVNIHKNNQLGSA